MHKRSSKKKEIAKRIAVYTLMSLAVATLVTVVVLFMLGYRLNVDERRLQQGALVQFGSTPSGANVFIDGDPINLRTPGKSSVSAGLHNFEISRDGYRTWKKTVDIKSGTLNWLNYALLVPTDLQLESIKQFDSLHGALSSGNNREILIQPRADQPAFELFDLRSDTPTSIPINLPASVYEPLSSDRHNFSMVAWDDGSRYVLLKHEYGNDSDWILMDVQQAARSVNISRLFNIDLKDVKFAGSGGSNLYCLTLAGDIRKLSLSDETMSRPLVGKVSTFEVYDSDIITYTGLGEDGSTLGLLREGDSTHIIKQLTTGQIGHIDTTKYFNENYIATSAGRQIVVLSGSYPSGSSSNSMRELTNFTVDKDIQSISFSPSGKYLLVVFKDGFVSYDLEYQVLSRLVSETGSKAEFKWLDDNYLWTDIGGELVIREYDGENRNFINQVVAGQDVALSHNNRYLYSIGKSSSGKSQLQRVQMVIR